MKNPFKLNSLLEGVGIPPKQTAILLHTPGERQLARLLPFLAQTEPEVLEAFQSIHSNRATATLRKCAYMASFVQIGSGDLVLAGVYLNKGDQIRPTTELRSLPAMRRVVEEFGANDVLYDSKIKEWPWFDFERLPALAEFVGRLHIKPRLTPTYARRAELLDADIVALSAGTVFSAPAPEWREFIVSGPELRTMPESWSARLREWRGIYLIVDESDGARYVGSAYGQENILGRWMAHIHREKGVTAELEKRHTRDFRFSILERVSPDLPDEDVIRLERTWMRRLHTIQHGLNT
jgi:hypothetical protein